MVQGEYSRYGKGLIFPVWYRAEIAGVDVKQDVNVLDDAARRIAAVSVPFLLR